MLVYRFLSWQQALSALENPAPVRLVGSGWILGIAAWLEILTRLPLRPDDQAWFDCGPRPALALAALKAGISHVMVDASPPVMEKLADMAGQLGGFIEHS